MYNNVLRLIYNGAKIGDDYCLELIKNLYKVYYKKEYNQLKRFKEITPDEIYAVSEQEYHESDYESVGRIMGIRMQMARTLALLKTCKQRRYQ